MIQACELCERELFTGRGARHPVACDDCAAVYHKDCWDEYERIHGHGCRVCCERQAEDEAENSKGG